MLSSGYPNNADSNVQKRYFETYKKVLDIKEDFLKTRTDWQSKVGSLSNAPRDIEVNGRRVPAGTSFYDFFDKQKQSNQTQKKDNNNYLSKRSYMDL